MKGGVMLFRKAQTHWSWYATVGADESATHAWEELRLFLYPLWRASRLIDHGHYYFDQLLQKIFCPTSSPTEIERSINPLDPLFEWGAGARIARQEILLVANDSPQLLHHLHLHMLHHLQLMDTKAIAANDDLS